MNKKLYDKERLDMILSETIKLVKSGIDHNTAYKMVMESYIIGYDANGSPVIEQIK